MNPASDESWMVCSPRLHLECKHSNSRKLFRVSQMCFPLNDDCRLKPLTIWKFEVICMTTICLCADCSVTYQTVNYVALVDRDIWSDYLMHCYGYARSFHVCVTWTSCNLNSLVIRLFIICVILGPLSPYFTEASTTWNLSSYIMARFVCETSKFIANIRGIAWSELTQCRREARKLVHSVQGDFKYTYNLRMLSVMKSQQSLR